MNDTKMSPRSSVLIRNFLLVICVLVPASVYADEPAITVYNQDFAVVRELIKLKLNKGINEVNFTDITTQMESDSLILRDPKNRVTLNILEQDYRADPVTQGLLLSLYEGQTIDFEVVQGENKRIVPGKIVRSGYVPGGNNAYRNGLAGQPIIETEGKLRFSLPGLPLFPELKDDTILKPTLHWLIEANRAGSLNAELAYITGGMDWEAAYNVVSPENSNELSLVGWVTMVNKSGKYFEDARVKLMAGNVSKLTRRRPQRRVLLEELAAPAKARPPAVTEKAFDEFHLYTLDRKVSLHDNETKQVQFINAKGVHSKTLYIYDGVDFNNRRYSTSRFISDSSYGTRSNPNVRVMREFKNSKENHLGIPLPKGRIRFYRRDTDGQMEFTGENLIDHTPRDETVRVYTGDAFDIRGERVRTDFHTYPNQRMADESFNINLNNHKKKAVEVRVVEHLYRWTNWNITNHSDPYNKTDSSTIEFRVKLQPDEKKTVNYTVRYSW